MAEQEKDKTEQATPFKLREAKRRGQVMKSLDFNSFFAITGLLGVLFVWGEGLMRLSLVQAQKLFEHAAEAVYDIPHLVGWLEEITVAVGHFLAPFFLVAVVMAIAANLVQTGPIFSTFPLKPDVQRLNPVSGFKRVFSLRMVFEGVKNLIKLALFGLVAYLVMAGLLPSLIGLSYMDPKSYAPLLLDQASQLMFKLALVVLVVALLDFAYTRWNFAKKMMMSRRELKEEIKRREGDPHVRAKIRELQKEAAKRSKSIRRVPDADVLITNPTHFAVALRYQQGAMSAPWVIAKGAGETAEKMRLAAARHGVPVFERPVLARRLFRECDIDQPVSETLFEPVARLYAELYALQPARMQVGVRT